MPLLQIRETKKNNTYTFQKESNYIGTASIQDIWTNTNISANYNWIATIYPNSPFKPIGKTRLKEHFTGGSLASLDTHLGMSGVYVTTEIKPSINSVSPQEAYKRRLEAVKSLEKSLERKRTRRSEELSTLLDNYE